MTKDLSNYMASELASFVNIDGTGIITNLSGLVRVREITLLDKTVRRIPESVDCEQQEVQVCENCEPITDLVPDQNKRCIVYFEGVSSIPLQSGDGFTKYRSQISLICWYNSKLFEQTENLQSRLISLFNSKIKPMAYTGSKVVDSLNVEVSKIIDSTPQIFAKYSYNEFRSQFLGCPFSSFQIDYQIDFISYEDQLCLLPIIVKPISDCC